MKQKGFTLVELMIAVTILGVVMAAVIMVLMNSERAKRQSEMLIDAQNHARAALEIVSRELKSAGYGIPMDSDQRAIAYAAPFECIFNSNITPFPNDTVPYSQPRAYDPAMSPSCPNYNPGIFFNTGAETYRYLFSTTDNLALHTFNPNDAVLIRQAYGQMTSGTNQIFASLNQHIAILLGQQGTTVIPMFQYWFRRNPADTRLALYGDTNGDSLLTGVERNFTSAPSSVLDAIEEITITVTAETRTPIGNSYRRVSLSTRINLFNIPPTTAKYYIRGHYFEDGTSTGIPGGEVSLSSGSITTTASDGAYEFSADPGTYVVRPQKLIKGASYYYLLRNPQDTIVTISTANAENVDFRYQPIPASDICRIIGKVYNDTIDPIGVPAEPQTGERGISGVSVSAVGKSYYTDSTFITLTTETDINGEYSLYLPRGIYTITEYDSVGYFSSTPNTVVDTLDPVGDVDTVNFGDFVGSAGIIKVKVWYDVDKDSLDDGLPNEKGLANVLCVVTKGGFEDIEVARGRTDANGIVLFYVPADSVYSVYEEDPDSMTSSAGISLGYNNNPADSVVSPYLNRVENISVPQGDTFRVKFGDAVGFITISLGETERVLSLVTPDLYEYRNPPGDKSNPASTSSDNDIVLGTVKASTSNMLVWYNLYVNASTSFGSLFPSNPHFSYDVGYDIPSLTRANFDAVAATPSFTDDIVAGLRGNTSGYNIHVALSHNGGGSGVNKDIDRGKLGWHTGGTVLKYSTSTAVASTDVLALATGLLTPSNQYDFVVGTKDAENVGHLEIWRNNGTGSAFARTSIITTDGVSALGEVRVIAVGDVVDSLGISGKDGMQDLIVGTKTGSHPNYRGQLIIFRRAGRNSLFVHHQTINYTDGYVNAIKAYDSGLLRGTILSDIAVGLRTVGSTVDDYRGRIELWHNNNNGSFGYSGSPNDQADPGGEVLSLDAGTIDIDLYNDLVAGIKVGDNVGGTLLYESSKTTRGYLPTTGRDPSSGEERGEVVVVRTTKFRSSPGRTDIITAVRELNASSQNVGKLVIYYNKF